MKDKDLTKRKLINAVGKIIAEKGYNGHLTNWLTLLMLLKTSNYKRLDLLLLDRQ
jgi:hypothetical protein